MHIIHRGLLKKTFKENTIRSFKETFKKNYGIETDIHATKDNEFICYHDFTLKRLFKINKCVKNLNYEYLKYLSKNKKSLIPLLKDLLKLSKGKYYLFIEIKPLLSIKLIKKLINETSKFKKCVFISFNEKNINNLLKLKKNINVGLSFSTKSSIKTIIKRSKNNKIKYLILDKSFIEKKKIKKINKIKFFYTIKKKKEFLKYCSQNNLIFENL